MFSRVLPSWEQIEQCKQPLTEGERHLLKFLDANLKRDEAFQDDDLTKYNGWLIFVQPFLNGSRPDIVILHPHSGVQIFEVKDWNLNNYDAMPKVVVRRGTRPDIPDAVGKNLEGDSWIVVLT